MRRAHITPGVATLAILLSSSGDFAIVLEHLLAQFDGVVVARADDVHYPPWTRNLANRYVVRESDGRDRVYYADPSEGHLNGFPIGTRVTKQRWRMDYEENVQRRNDFPFVIYAFWMTIDFALLMACVILAIMMNIRDRHNCELAAAVERGKRLLESER